MYQVIIVIHVLLGLGVISLVLLQQGKGADAGAAFGSASSGSVFGAQGASSFLSRATAILAALFFSTSLGLAVLSSQQDGPVDLMDSPEVEEVFTDLPLVNEGSNNSVEPIKAIPMIKNDIPSASVVSEGVSNVTGAVTNGVNTVVDSVGNATEAMIDGAKSGASNVADTIGESVESAESKVGAAINK